MILPNSPLEIPGVAEMVVNERRERDAAFMPVTESIGPFEAIPLTLFHVLLLRLMDSPLLGSAAPTTVDLAAFLWVVSPDYAPKASFRRWLFMRRCRKAFVPPESPRLFKKWRTRSFEKRYAATITRADAIIKAVRAYVDNSFADKSPSKANGGYKPDYYSDAASVCGLFAREYGWTDEDTIHKPLKMLLQFMKEIHHHADPKAVMFNESDRAIGDYLAKVNEDIRNN